MQHGVQVLSASREAIELNPSLDAAAFARAFAQDGRLHIPVILTPRSAERVHRCLAQETPWTLIVNKNGTRQDLPAITTQERIAHAQAAWEYGRENFAYVYDNHRLSHKGEAYPRADHYLARIVEFLNGRPFLEFMRRVTGMEAIAFADAQATLYRPGDFLSPHEDDFEGKNRLAAYVLNMTPQWRGDWGGQLQFLDADGQVESGYVPAFNALNVFHIPKTHWVSQVAFHGGLRYSVTGWLRTL
jgi:Rps23 Pro-64 3,4-dihydroxylase Tpa1-like proline 4-hydroxylase